MSNPSGKWEVPKKWPSLELAGFGKIESLIEQRFHVLDDGEVMLVDVMGNDAAIVQAARVSYGAGTKAVSDDRALIRYLMRHRHTTPFEMCELKFRIRIPMDHWRQMVRHRTANINEYSTRYSEAIDSAQQTLPGLWRLQSGTNKQGSGDFINEKIGELLSIQEADLQRQAREVYETRLEAGVAREQARKDLPLSTYTEAYWKCDLHNLLHFCTLRMDEHAQAEIRAYAKIIGERFVAPLFPLTWEAFEDYRLNAYTLSRMELRILQIFLTKGQDHEDALNEWCQMSKREQDDFRRRFKTSW